ncbi:MAG: flagellar motor protein MotB [Planctomycetaceae bacterium]
MEESQDDDVPGVPEWIVTYGDMMSLLLTFFIMLVSMSEVRSDKGKTRAMMDGIRRAFGPTSSKRGMPGRGAQTSSALGKMASKGGRSQGGTEVGGRKAKGVGGAHANATRIRDGTLVTLGGPAQFERLQATLSPHLRRNLDIVARVVGPKNHRIMIRGHASPETFPTNATVASAAVGSVAPWPKEQDRDFLVVNGLSVRDAFDLSFARARAVAEYLVSKKIDRRRLIVTAAGATERRLMTRDWQAQNLNRRVDVFLIDSYITHPR